MRLVSLAGAVMCLGAVATPAPRDPQPDEAARSLELPRTWKLEDIAREAPPYPYAAEDKVYVLAWLIEEDDRPLRVETCLVLKELAGEDKNGRWCLSHLYRHPRGKDADWHLPPVWVSPPAPLGPEKAVAIPYAKRFKTKPTNKDIYASFEEVQWRFAVDRDWKLISCAVCERNWAAAIGEKPTQFFGTK